MEKVEDYQTAFTEAVEKIIACNILFRNSSKNPDGIRFENCAVIKVASNRRAGHTTTLFNVAKKFFKEPIFIFPNKCQRDFFIEQKGLGLDSCCLSSNLDSIIGTDRDAILVDNASFIPNNDMEKINYIAERMFNRNKNFCLILIG